MDQRIQKFAEKLVNYCISVQEGENVMLSLTDTDALPLVTQLINEIYKAGGNPFVSVELSQVQRALLLQCNEEQMKLKNAFVYDELQKMDGFIAIRGFCNAAELSDVPDEKMRIDASCSRAQREWRANKLKWVGLRYPNFAIAQLAHMSLEAYEDFIFDVCNMDYADLSVKMDKLVECMNKTDKVRITGKGTDLSFSIKGIPAIKCDAKLNIPDGEVFTAPVRDSVNGVVTFNIPSVYQSRTFEQIRLEFLNGKIIKATCNDTEKLNEILDIDEGARYLGEFSFGVNPKILVPTNDGSIDEKLACSIHLTPGACYDEAPNGNQSKIHWDLVLLQTPEYGGGEIYFDDQLIRKDGLFVPPSLAPLNPDFAEFDRA